MARIRSIKPEFPHSESMGRVSRDARLCFVLLWTIADDEGRLRGNPRMLASLLFPYDSDAPKHIERWLNELQKENCIVRYRVNANEYVEIVNWREHQRIDKPTKSKIDPFDPQNHTHEPSRILPQGQDHSREPSRILANPPDPCHPGGSIAGENPREDSSGDGNGMDRSGEEGRGVDASPSLPSVLDCEVFQTRLADWLAYKGKGAYKPRGLQAMVSRAAKLADRFGVAAVCDAMERAMANNWKGWDQESSFAKLPPSPASRLATKEESENYSPQTGLGG